MCRLGAFIRPTALNHPDPAKAAVKRAAVNRAVPNPARVADTEVAAAADDRTARATSALLTIAAGGAKEEIVATVADGIEAKAARAVRSRNFAADAVTWSTTKTTSISNQLWNHSREPAVMD